MVKNLKDKKDSAEILSNFGPILLSAIVVLILVVLFGSWMANFEKKDAVNQISRKYILRMETKGGLSTADETELKKELQPYCKNVWIDYDGNKTTREGEAKYGEDIDLYIKAELYTYKIGLASNRTPGNVWQLTNDGEVINDGQFTVAGKTQHVQTITIHRSSTSKH